MQAKDFKHWNRLILSRGIYYLLSTFTRGGIYNGVAWRTEKRVAKCVGWRMWRMPFVSMLSSRSTNSLISHWFFYIPFHSFTYSHNCLTVASYLFIFLVNLFIPRSIPLISQVILQIDVLILLVCGEVDSEFKY